MPRYKIGHAYRSTRDGIPFGPWEEGEVVELEEADAEWLERDSPGVLAPEAPTRKKSSAAADRQHRGGQNRSG